MPLAEFANDPQAARNFAMQVLARRDHCRAELVLKLIRQGFERELAARTVAAMVEEKLVDDARYVQNFVVRQAEDGFGPTRVAYKLGAPSLEIDAGLIKQFMGEEADWVKRARVVRAKKFGEQMPAEYREIVKQAYFLQHRGFTAAQIRLAMGTDIEIDDDWK